MTKGGRHLPSEATSCLEYTNQQCYRSSNPTTVVGVVCRIETIVSHSNSAMHLCDKTTTTLPWFPESREDGVALTLIFGTTVGETDRNHVITGLHWQ